MTPSTSAVHESTESLAMFFDSDFNPEKYLDSLFQLSRSNPNPSIGNVGTTPKGLSDLSNQISGLITHLDYYTNELSTNLEEKLELLSTNSSLVGGTDSANGTTRLQYYVNVLNNSILSLQSELATVNADIDGEHSGDNSAVQDLISLKLVKANLGSVLKIYEFVYETIVTREPNSDSNLTAENFQTILNQYLVSVKSLADSQNPQPLLDQIDKLIEHGNLLNNLNKFGPAYKQFIGKLIAERENFQKTKR